MVKKAFVSKISLFTVSICSSVCSSFTFYLHGKCSRYGDQKCFVGLSVVMEPPKGISDGNTSASCGHLLVSQLQLVSKIVATLMPVHASFFFQLFNNRFFF